MKLSDMEKLSKNDLILILTKRSLAKNDLMTAVDRLETENKQLKTTIEELKWQLRQNIQGAASPVNIHAYRQPFLSKLKNAANKMEHFM